jgi:hypothetical protein
MEIILPNLDKESRCQFVPTTPWMTDPSPGKVEALQYDVAPAIDDQKSKRDIVPYFVERLKELERLKWKTIFSIDCRADAR